MRLYAHSTERGEDTWQPLSDHLNNVAALAGEFAEFFKSRDWAEATGLLHDRGKASIEYLRRLRGSNRKVDHSTAGAQYAANEFEGAGRLIAACIAGHHGGLQDGGSEQDSCLAARLKRIVPEVIQQEELPSPVIGGKFPFKPERSRTGLAFQVSFFTRMLFSCLVDADFLDTEHFMNSEKSLARQGYPSLVEIESRFRAELESVQAKARPAAINLRRREILEACLAGATQSRGLFSLTVPTGGGKTLSSLAFALRHARLHGMRRVIYVIPFTSIIEQNADVFRKFAGKDAVLEHHSAFDTAKLDGADSENDEMFRRFELSSENWDAPLVVTTAVQFFESLFSSRTSRCRKLHNIAGSVVILDEAQMLPVRFLLPCLEALRELAANYATSVVLCTATQPALTRNEEFQNGLEDVREIVPDPKALYRDFRRVKIEKLGTVSLKTLIENLRSHEQDLCVVNTRSEARDVFQGLGDVDGAFHLSALMCPEHRSQKLAEIKDRLARNLPCLVVSTRLIEAGVDIDFPVVYRAVAGIDSIAQAAGRCNREGKLLEPGRVILYELENKPLPGAFRAPAEAAAETIRQYPDDPLSLEAVEDYFRLLYWRAGERLDEKQILEDLVEGLNDCYFPFRTVSEKFRLIEETGESVIIPFDDRSRGLIRDLRFAEFPGKVLRQLQRYTVQVPRWGIAALEASGALERIQDIYPALSEYGYDRFYGSGMGLSIPKEGEMSAESLVF